MRKAGPSLGPVEQLLACTENNKSSPYVKIIRNKAAESAAAALRKRGPRSSKITRPGPKSLTRRLCCYLCHANLHDKVSSDSWILTQSNIHLLNQFVFNTTEFEELEEEKDLLNRICTGCCKAINRIEEFKREMDKIQGKIKEIVQCIRAVYRANNKLSKNRSKSSSGTRHRKSPLQMVSEDIEITPTFFMGDVLDVKSEIICDDTDETEDAFFEIVPDSVYSCGSEADDHEEEVEENNYSSINKASSSSSSSKPFPTRPSRQSKNKASQFLQSIAHNEKKGKTNISDDKDMSFNPGDVKDFSNENGDNGESSEQTRPPKRQWKIPQVCKDCGETLPSLVEHWSHVKDIHNRDPSECQECGKKYGTRRAYLHHYRKAHEGLKKFKCTESNCNEQFSRKCPFKKHVAWHRKLTSKSDKQVEIVGVEDRGGKSCSAKATTAKKYSKPKPKLCTCNKCGKIYPTQKSHNRHQREQHSNEPNRHICHICGKGFPFERILRNHLNYHNKEKAKCETCGVWFKNLPILRNHINCVHKKIRSYICDRCGKVYARKLSLTLHNYKHQTNEERMKSKDKTAQDDIPSSDVQKEVEIPIISEPEVEISTTTTS